MSMGHRRQSTVSSGPTATGQDVSLVAVPPGPSHLIRDHRERWRRGERMTAESYIRKLGPKPVNPADLLDLVYNEVLLREEDGESPQLGEYLDRFPGHAEALRVQFEVHEALRSNHSVTLTLSTIDRDSSEPPRGLVIDESAASPPHTTARPVGGHRSDLGTRAGAETPKVAVDQGCRHSRPELAPR